MPAQVGGNRYNPLDNRFYGAPRPPSPARRSTSRLVSNNVPDVTSTIAFTEADDTAALVATLTIPSAIAFTEAADTAALAGSESIPSAIAYTEASDTAALAGSQSIPSTITYTEAADSAALAASQSIPSTLTFTEDPDTAALAGTGGTDTPPTFAASPGNALGVLFTTPTYIDTPRCRCIPGQPPSKACPLHCQTIQARQAAEDELVTLSLV